MICTNDNRRLLKSLLWGSPGSVFLCVAMNGKAGQAIDAINAAIAPGLSSQTLCLADVAGPWDLVDRFQQNAEPQSVTHLMGATEWLRQETTVALDTSRPYQQPFIHAVNMLRENMFRTPGRKIWWLEEDDIGFIATEAVDFFNWRAGTYRIDADAKMALPKPPGSEGPKPI